MKHLSEASFYFCPKSLRILNPFVAINPIVQSPFWCSELPSNAGIPYGGVASTTTLPWKPELHVENKKHFEGCTETNANPYDTLIYIKVCWLPILNLMYTTNSQTSRQLDSGHGNFFDCQQRQILMVFSSGKPIDGNLTYLVQVLLAMWDLSTTKIIKASKNIYICACICI